MLLDILRKLGFLDCIESGNCGIIFNHALSLSIQDEEEEASGNSNDKSESFLAPKRARSEASRSDIQIEGGKQKRRETHNNERASAESERKDSRLQVSLTNSTVIFFAIYGFITCLNTQIFYSFFIKILHPPPPSSPACSLARPSRLSPALSVCHLPAPRRG
jgi:hypothetical protein